MDYRTFNQRTIQDQYTVPRTEDALHRLSDSKWFSVLGLRGGYCQIPMSEAEKCFHLSFGFEQMPQGICGVPGIFQSHGEGSRGHELVY